LINDRKWKQDLVEGSTNTRPIPVVFCDEGEDPFTEEDKPYVAVEIEFRFMGYYRRFGSKNKYEAYCEERKALRERYVEIETLEGKLEVAGQELTKLKEEWLEQALSWRTRWGEMNASEDVRLAIDKMLQDTRAGACVHWNPFRVQMTSPNSIGNIDVFKHAFEEL
jgi:hypothetical protein